MPCNLRLPDAPPVLFHFNYDAPAKFEVAQPFHCRLWYFYCWFLTLRCDLYLVFLTYLHNKQYNKEANELSQRYCWILGVGHNWQSFLRGAWTQVHQTWWGHKAIIAAMHFCFRVWILYCIFKCRQLKAEWFVSDLENDAKFAHFDPLWKLKVF